MVSVNFNQLSLVLRKSRRCFPQVVSDASPTALRALRKDGLGARDAGAAVLVLGLLAGAAAYSQSRRVHSTLLCVRGGAPRRCSQQCLTL